MDWKRGIWIFGILAMLCFCFVATATAQYGGCWGYESDPPKAIAEQVEIFLEKAEENRSVEETEYSGYFYTDEICYYLIVPNESGKTNISQYSVENGHFTKDSSLISVESFLEKTENESDEFGYCVVAFQRKQIMNESAIQQRQTEIEESMVQGGKALLIFVCVVVLIILFLINPWYAFVAIMFAIYAYVLRIIFEILGIGM